jgi:hypothetical protein
LRSPDFASSMILAAIASFEEPHEPFFECNAHETRGLRIKYMAI